MDFDLTPTAQLFSKSKVHLSPCLRLGDKEVSVEEIIKKLEPLLLDERVEKVTAIVENRSLQVMTVLENIYDRGNVSAVMRTAESLGFYRFLILEKEGARFKAANRITKGAEKWLDVDVCRDVNEGIGDLKAEGYRIIGTDLQATHELSDIPTDQPLALVIGNEKDGISEEMRDLVDIKVKIPMVGFSQSYNLSVASALCLFELYKRFDPKEGMTTEQRRQLYANYLLRSFDRPEKFFCSRSC